MKSAIGFSGVLALLLQMVACDAVASTDPVQADPNTGSNYNRYVYANNNPYRFTDPDGRRSVVENDRIKINPEDKSVPAVSLPNNVGARGVSPSDLSFHQYNVETNSNLSGAQAGKGFRTNPTPGNDAAASPTGALNDAGPIPTTDGTNMVRSYSIPSPDSSRFSDITVNYTVAGEHGLNEGFVVRFGEINGDGTTTLRSYGEGNNWRQHETLKGLGGYGWGSQVENVWQQNHQEIINGTR